MNDASGAWVDGYWWSNDGLRLHYRDYPGSGDRSPILCLPGLTRNARDFGNLAARLSPGRRVIVPEMRGRGDSGYARDPMTYVPLVYVQDIARLLDELGIGRFAAIGTSLGGIIAMLIGATERDRLTGVLLNDVGAIIEPVGLERIKANTGRSGSWPTWVHTARAVAQTNASVFPNYDLAEWLAMAKRLYKLTPNGRVVPDYDKRIAEPFRVPGNEAGVDLWPAVDALTDVPALLVRGGLSDLLSPSVAEAMLARWRQGALVTVPGVGHAPTLDEPEAVAGIDAWLARVA